MEKEKKNSKVLIIIALIITIAVMSVGYASLAQRLIVTSNANLGDTTWNVKIVEITETDKSITGEEVIPTTSVGAIKGTPNATNIAGSPTATFDVQLNAPGDYAVFKVAVKNLGTISAKLNEITDLTTLNASIPEGLKYTVTPDSTNNAILAAGAYHFYTIRVDYTNDHITLSDDLNVEEDNTTVKLASKTATIHFDYVQG